MSTLPPSAFSTTWPKQTGHENARGIDTSPDYCYTLLNEGPPLFRSFVVYGHPVALFTYVFTYGAYGIPRADTLIIDRVGSVSSPRGTTPSAVTRRGDREKSKKKKIDQKWKGKEISRPFSRSRRYRNRTRRPVQGFVNETVPWPLPNYSIYF